jgi:hypothetical protein
MKYSVKYFAWLPALNFLGLSLLAGAIALVIFPAIGQESNFGKLALNSSKSSGMLTGSTGGTTSLPAIVSNTDRNNNQCMGFADPKPDHVLVLQQDFSTLSVRVRRGSPGTTLVIQGPRGFVRCGNSTESGEKANITDINWPEGTYRIWVGSATPGAQQEYSLMVQP